MDKITRLQFLLKCKLENFTKNCTFSEKKLNYLSTIEQNLRDSRMDENHKQEYKQANGHELKNKMKAVYSSSAFTFNTFGNSSCNLHIGKWGLQPGRYQLYYEYKDLPTLNKTHKINANIDVYLQNGLNDHLFIEMKLLEPLTKHHTFKSIESYLNQNYYIDKDSFSVFSELFNKYGKNGLEYFDIAQMLKHLLGIYNHFFCTKHSCTNVALINCYWQPESESVLKKQPRERRSLQELYNIYEENSKKFSELESSVSELFKKINVNIHLGCIKWKKILPIIGKDNDEYLKRYII